jgi:biotin transport system permease protein
VGLKLVLLVLAGAGSIFVHHPWQVGVLLAVVVALYVLSGFSLVQLGRQARPLLGLLVVVGAVHVLVNGWERAVVVVGVILALVLLAGLVTLTSTTTALVGSLVAALRPTRRIGVDPDRVGLLLALSIRSVPVVAALAAEVRDAQRARGLTSSVRAFAVPLIIRALRHADQLGEALVARGVDD